jgi:hypothetical protein
MRPCHAALVFICLGCAGVGHPSALAAEPPGFAITLDNGALRTYGPPARGLSEYSVSDDVLEATVGPAEPDEWVLTIVTRDVNLRDVSFPWEAEQVPVGASIDDDVIYVPYRLGVARRATDTKEWGWEGFTYPGLLISPLAVVADARDARLVAAANWPPRRVQVLFSRGRLSLTYREGMTAGGVRSFGALLAAVEADSARGQIPWHTALDVYKRWLSSRLREAGLTPARYDERLRRTHGWINVQLENEPEFDPLPLIDLWQRWGKRLGWMQFWGQMSNYDGPAHLARPALRTDEKTGCCLDYMELHPRYGDPAPPPAWTQRPARPRSLRAVVEQVKRDGGLVGFYTRPRDPYRALDDPRDDAGDTRFLLEWQRHNHERYGANASYIDVIGARDFGHPLEIARLLRDQIKAPTVIEFLVDVYPAPALVSGCLTGGAWNGGPGGDVLRHPRTTAPAFGRYLLDDRILFLGESNDDGRHWGAARRNWTERQAFLLGAKLDAISLHEPDGRENWAVKRIIELRDKLRWWTRDPIYRDRAGIYDVSPGVDVRRFETNDGEHLFVIDNWNRRRDATFTFQGSVVRVPSEALSILAGRPAARSE